MVKNADDMVSDARRSALVIVEKARPPACVEVFAEEFGSALGADAKRAGDPFPYFRAMKRLSCRNGLVTAQEVLEITSWLRNVPCQ